MSRIGGDDEDTFPNSSKLDSQTTAREMTQERLVQPEVGNQDRAVLNKSTYCQQHLFHKSWAVSPIRISTKGFTDSNIITIVLVCVLWLFLYRQCVQIVNKKQKKKLSYFALFFPFVVVSKEASTTFLQVSIVSKFKTLI